MFAQILGGIGFFLLGMTLMTDGLKAVAGDALRIGLQKFTRGPLTGTLIGAAVTALIQTSSATILATIGFVSAGLLPFTNALGLIFGANIGTTTTGWMLSLLGLRFSISVFALPLVGIGTLLHLFGRGRMSPGGLALAGFGLIFVAIDTLQAGMGSLAGELDPTLFAVDGLWGRLLLVIVGIVMTILLQSSTVALVTTMAALHAGTMSLEPAAALVVGQNIGTTFTAALAAVGANTAAKRTALAHVLFNVITGGLAFFLLPVMVGLVTAGLLQFGLHDDAVSLAAFHSVFSLCGIFLLLPVVGPFARLIERLIPERTQALTVGLDISAAEVPVAALEASRTALLNIFGEVCAVLRRRSMGAPVSSDFVHRDALAKIRVFLAELATQPSDDVLHARHVALFHVGDHLEVLLQLMHETFVATPADAPEQTMERLGFLSVLEAMARWHQEESTESLLELEARNSAIADHRRTIRRETLSQAASGHVALDTAESLLHYVSWLDSCAYRVARAAHYLHKSNAKLSGEGMEELVTEELTEELTEEPVAEEAGE